PAVRRTRVHLQPVFAWRDEGVRQMVRLSGWTFGYVATNQVAQLFVLVLAKTGSSGDVTAYVYAFTFYVLPHSLLAVSIMTTMTPELARRATADDLPGLRRDFALGLRYLIVLTLPASVLFAVLAQPMIGVLTIGKFTVHSAQVTGDTLQLFAISLVAFSLYLYTLRAFYAMADTRTPFLLNLGENALNIVLAVALWGPLGIQGLALAWSISYFVAAAASFVVLRRRVGAGMGAGAVAAATRAALGSLLPAFVAIVLAAAIGDEPARRSLAATIVATTAGGLAYVLVLAATRSEELGAIVGMVRRRGRKA